MSAAGIIRNNPTQEYDVFVRIEDDKIIDLKYDETEGYTKIKLLGTVLFNTRHHYRRILSSSGKELMSDRCFVEFYENRDNLKHWGQVKREIEEILSDKRKQEVA